MRSLLIPLLAFTACAPKLVTPAPQMDAQTNKLLHDAQAQMLMAQREAERSCEFLRTLEPDEAEERLIGTFMAAQELKNGQRSLYLEPGVEAQRTAIQQGLDQGTLEALPHGPPGSVTARVAEVGKKVASASTRPHLAWSFGVVQSDEARAFGTPGGFVFITTGLLKKLTNEAQLAGILGHEVGHVVLKHQLHAYRDGREKLCVTSKSLAAALKAAPDAQLQVEGLKFAHRFQQPLGFAPGDEFARFLAFATASTIALSRTPEQEFDVDRVTLELLGASGYAAEEYETVLGTLPKDGFGPEPAARVARLKALREGPFKPMLKGKAKPDLTKALAPLKP